MCIERLLCSGDTLAVGIPEGTFQLDEDNLSQGTPSLTFEGIGLGHDHPMAVEIEPQWCMAVQKVGISLEVGRGAGQASPNMDRMFGKP